MRAATSFCGINGNESCGYVDMRSTTCTKAVRVVVRPHDALQRVAVRAVAYGGLLLLGARQAREPFGVRKLRREIGGLAKFQIGSDGFASGDVNRVQGLRDRSPRRGCEAHIAPGCSFDAGN